VRRRFGVGWSVQTTQAGAAGGCAGNEQASAIEVDSGGTPHSPVRIHIAFY
jgi:hypothetical protein